MFIENFVFLEKEYENFESLFPALVEEVQYCIEYKDVTRMENLQGYIGTLKDLNDFQQATLQPLCQLMSFYGVKPLENQYFINENNNNNNNVMEDDFHYNGRDEDYSQEDNGDGNNEEEGKDLEHNQNDQDKENNVNEGNKESSGNEENNENGSVTFDLMNAVQRLDQGEEKDLAQHALIFDAECIPKGTNSEEVFEQLLSRLQTETKQQVDFFSCWEMGYSVYSVGIVVFQTKQAATSILKLQKASPFSSGFGVICFHSCRLSSKELILLRGIRQLVVPLPLVSSMRKVKADEKRYAPGRKFHYQSITNYCEIPVGCPNKMSETMANFFTYNAACLSLGRSYNENLCYRLTLSRNLTNQNLAENIIEKLSSVDGVILCFLSKPNSFDVIFASKEASEMFLGNDSSEISLVNGKQKLVFSIWKHTIEHGRKFIYPFGNSNNPKQISLTRRNSYLISKKQVRGRSTSPVDLNKTQSFTTRPRTPPPTASSSSSFSSSRQNTFPYASFRDLSKERSHYLILGESSEDTRNITHSQATSSHNHNRDNLEELDKYSSHQRHGRDRDHHHGKSQQLFSYSHSQVSTHHTPHAPQYQKSIPYQSKEQRTLPLYPVNSRNPSSFYKDTTHRDSGNRYKRDYNQDKVQLSDAFHSQRFFPSSSLSSSSTSWNNNAHVSSRNNYERSRRTQEPNHSQKQRSSRSRSRSRNQRSSRSRSRSMHREEFHHNTRRHQF